MAIKINHQGDPNGYIHPPEVRISGKEVNSSDGTLDSITRIYSRDNIRLIGSETQTTARDVDHRASDAFLRSVTVTILPDTSSGFSDNQSTWRKTVEDREVNNNNVFVGEQPGSLTQNETMYTYYTVNGKDPKRTKANLYTGPFTVRQDKSGCDNYILKVRSYIHGISSKVKTVDFRIVGIQIDQNKINKLTREASST